MEYLVTECNKTAQTLYNMLTEAKVSGLHNKVQYENDCLFLVIMPDFANDDLHCPNNIFIDIEEYGEHEGKLLGQIKLHHGFAHAHFDYGRTVSMEDICKDVVQTVIDLIDNQLYSFALFSPIGANTTGFRYVLGDLSPKMSFEGDLITDYYFRNIYKPGMEEFPSQEQCQEIAEKLHKSYENISFRTLLFKDKEPSVGTLFKSTEEK